MLFNSKLRREFIPNDPHPQDKNGKHLADIIKRNKLTVANAQLSVKGVGAHQTSTTSLNPTSKHSSPLREPSKGGR